MKRSLRVLMAPVVYLVLEVIIVGMSSQIEPSLTDINSPTFFIFLILVAFTNLAYFIVHLKDPGYLQKDAAPFSDISSRVDEQKFKYPQINSNMNMQQNNSVEIKQKELHMDNEIRNQQQLPSFANPTSDLSGKIDKEGQEEKDEIQCEPSQPLDQITKSNIQGQKHKNNYQGQVFNFHSTGGKEDDQEKEDEVINIDLILSEDKKLKKKSISHINKGGCSTLGSNIIEDSTKATSKSNEQFTTFSNSHIPQPISSQSFQQNYLEDANATYFINSSSRSPQFLQQFQASSLSQHLFQQQKQQNLQQSVDLYSPKTQPSIQNGKNEISSIDFSVLDNPYSNNEMSSKILGQVSSPGFRLSYLNKHKINTNMNSSSQSTINNNDSMNNFGIVNNINIKEKKQSSSEEIKMDNNLLKNSVSFFREKLKQQQQKYDEKQLQDRKFEEIRNCLQCNIVQRMRSKHCKICNKCIATYDHHCPWVGNCIGEKNKCIFWWFLLMQASLILFTLIEVIISITVNSNQNLPLPLVITDIILLSGFFLMVICLLIYHTYLASENITTWESVKWEQVSYLKDWPQDIGSPFSRGFFKNLRNYCIWTSKKTPLITWYIPKLTPQHQIPSIYTPE